MKNPGKFAERIKLAYFQIAAFPNWSEHSSSPVIIFMADSLKSSNINEKINSARARNILWVLAGVET